MIAFSFIFTEDPVSGENEQYKMSVIANSEDDAWQSVAKQFNVPVQHLKSMSPTIQMKYLPPIGTIVVSHADSASDPNDPWPQIVSGGIRDVTTAIKETVSTTHKERMKIEMEAVKTDRFLMNVFSVVLIGSLSFSFYLIYIDRTQAVFSFLFPIITAVIGLISGYFAGKSSGERSSR